jgi:hypothetical protein
VYLLHSFFFPFTRALPFQGPQQGSPTHVFDRARLLRAIFGRARFGAWRGVAWRGGQAADGRQIWPSFHRRSYGGLRGNTSAGLFVRENPVHETEECFEEEIFFPECTDGGEHSSINLGKNKTHYTIRVTL